MLEQVTMFRWYILGCGAASVAPFFTSYQHDHYMAEHDTNTLQAAIEARAAKQLDSDLARLYKLVSEDPIMGLTDHELPQLKYLKKEGSTVTVDGKQQQLTPEVWETASLRQLFHYVSTNYTDPRHYSSSVYMDRLRAFLLPDYVQQHTETFLREINELKEKVNYLFDNQPEANDY